MDMQWRTLKQRHTDCRLVVLLQIVHGLIQIPPTNYLKHISQKPQLYILINKARQEQTIILNGLSSPPPSVITCKAQVSKLQHITEYLCAVLILM